MSALICGSFAFDNIMVFPDRFKEHILPDKIHMLNVSFLVPEMRREFGGCAGNIAYNLKLIGGDPLPMGAVGADFAPYSEWMNKCDISQHHLTEIVGSFTAQAFITTDLDDNQITAFHPGSMNEAHINNVADVENVSIGIISPDGRDGMIQHAEQFVEASIPFIFDPGQAMPMFDGDDLKRFIEQATWVSVNDYEWELMQERTGYSEKDVLQHVKALIVTRGSEGADIHTRNEMVSIPVAKVDAVVDPTGCGDAFRAGLLYGLMKDLDWETTGRIASLLGGIKIEQHGTQNHSFTMDEFKIRYQNSFSVALEL